MNEKDKILEHCFYKFVNEGFHKTTMDEIAKELRISKKTIYKHFNSKEEIISEVLNSLMKKVENKYKTVISKNINAVEKIYGILSFISEVAFQISKDFIKDLQLKGGANWEKVHNFRTNILNKHMPEIFKQGIDEGLVKDYDPGLMIKIFLSVIEGVLNPEYLLNSRHSFKSAGETVFEIIFNGFLTKKGKKILKKHKQDK